MKQFAAIAIPVSFCVGFCSTIAGAILHIMHYPFSIVFLAAGVISALIFFVAALYELNSSNKISHREKILWTTGFLLSAWLTGILYIVKRRRRIAA